MKQRLDNGLLNRHPKWRKERCAERIGIRCLAKDDPCHDFSHLIRVKATKALADHASDTMSDKYHWAITRKLHDLKQVARHCFDRIVIFWGLRRATQAA
jgi:hypothetical protein